MDSVEALRALVESAREEDHRRAWEALLARPADLAKSRELAFILADLLARDPTFPQPLPLAEKALAAFGQDSELVIALTAGLLRVAEQRPPDEPPFVQGPAHLVAGACQRCFEELSSEDRLRPELGGYLQLNLADGLRMMGPDHDEDAQKAYALALTIDDSNGAFWFHLGLLHKWRGRFEAGLEANKKALVRLGPRKPVLWNLALCATALGEGQLAAETWQKLGIPAEVTASKMPLVRDMPPMQLRVATVGEELGQGDPLPAKTVAFEVLWLQPLSPCHGVVQSPTARRASIDYGDLVLYDGAPVRMAEVEGRPVPIFPLIWLLRPGKEQRLRFVAMESRAGLLEGLGGDLGEGLALVTFDKRAGDGSGPVLYYGKLIVSPDVPLGEVRKRLTQGLSRQRGLTLAVPQLYELLKDTPEAGKSHQAWGGIERAAERAGLLSARRAQ